MANFPTANRLSLEHWLLAETVRRTEEAAGRFDTEDSATMRARRSELSLPQRIVQRARLRPEAPGLMTDISLFLQTAGWLYLALALIGLVSGLGAARAVLGSGGVLMLSWAFVALLLVPTLLLLLWLLSFLLLGRGHGGGLPGRLALWLAPKLALARPRSRSTRLLIASFAEYVSRDGRKLAAIATHGFWAAFFIGAVLMMTLRFGGDRYDFAWGTTLLSEPTIRSAIEILGLPAALLGFELPAEGQIRHLLEERSPVDDRRLWGWFALGAVAFWGLLPRLLLVAGFWLAWHRGRQRLALDLTRPGYVRLLPALAGDSRVLPESDAQAPGSIRSPRRPRVAAGSGAPVLVGIELERAEADWPPPLPKPDWRVLGRIDRREDLNGVLAALETIRPRPAAIIAVCSLARTPDRNLEGWLLRLAEHAPVQLWLDDVEAIRARGEAPEARMVHWLDLARRLELDAPRRLDAIAATES